MKQRMILLLLLAGALQTLWAQPAIRERAYVQTDKESYLAGELVWMKMITTTPDGHPLPFSKVGYVELLDSASARVQTKLMLQNGTGSATLLLPTSLPTGCYRLVGYTRHMQNESPEIFFEKILGVINPLSPEVARPDHGSAGLFPGMTGEANIGNRGIRVAVDNNPFAPRSRVEARISGLPEKMHTLSISVSGRDVTGILPVPGLDRWNNALPGLTAGPLSSEYLAEYEGHIVLGKIAAEDSGVSDTWLLPMLAFPGNDVQVFDGRTTGNGTVLFFTQGADGYRETITTVSGTHADKYHIDIESPFARNHLVKALPLPDLARLDKEQVQKQSVAMQVQYAYLNDSLMRFDYNAPHFFWKPDKRYIMEEYTKFGTLGEVLTEFVTFVRFTRIDGKRKISLAQETTGFNNSSTLVLLDGVPVLDHELLWDYNPLLLERIDVYYERYVMGGKICDGIVALYTAENKYPELKVDPSTRFFSYESPQAPRLFFSPDHSAGVRNRLPDYRHTLYWDADLRTEGNDTVTVPFYTSDLTGDFRITVEGLTSEGETVSATADFRVR